MAKNSKKIVIVGGGAGGLELAARLCNTFKSTNSIKIILVDKSLKHVWKPLYHAVAAGSFIHYPQEIDYMSYAYQKGFTFVLGSLQQINQQEESILLAPFVLNPEKDLVLSKRQLEYDILVLALGSHTNDFDIPGVKEHCLLLDSLEQAELCNKILLDYIMMCTQGNLNPLTVHIVGGGATGVELAAELNYVLTRARKYAKKTRLLAYDFQITLIESGERILNMLPERISYSVTRYLHNHKINLRTQTKITAVEKNGLFTANGEFIPSHMMIWAAGIKSNVSTVQHNLEVNKINQLLVKPTLQTTQKDDIFAFGDCASCPQKDKQGKIYTVPPRAQAAHQQAHLLAQSLLNYLNGKPLPTYRYRDYGSLISLSRYNVGQLMGGKIAKSLYIEGALAGFAYWLLYKRHVAVLRGIYYTLLHILGEFFMKKQGNEIKLH